MKFQPQDKAAWNFILFYFNYIHSTHSFHFSHCFLKPFSCIHSLGTQHHVSFTLHHSSLLHFFNFRSLSAVFSFNFLASPFPLCLCSVFCAIGLCKFLLFRGKYFSFFIYLLKKICFKSLVKLLHWQVLGKFWTFQWQTFPIEILS